jgi:hypothetical protein
LLDTGEPLGLAREDRFSLLHVVEGAVEAADGRRWAAGSTLLLGVNAGTVAAVESALVLRTHIP